ncbi:hypothetical protein [Aureispira anguillae]|uniref:Uncharacterized protein n=1 Tax=Aureispira anguillae TaxID=2864201 RepID=A0A916DVC8_9BACT|nr:hypothetical protein [Aureispira anguillae]BDS13016.1 hypothetical protein AsAng_0037440 [Aureispira anguillae]
MNLIFKEKEKGKANCFIEKIWQSLDVEWKDLYLYANAYKNQFGNYWEGTETKNLAPKKHTIRRDGKDRWQEGSLIHFIINPYNENRFQFAPILPVTAIQSIKINVRVDDFPVEGYIYSVIIDGKGLDHDDIEELAENDGFDSLEEFLTYFEGGFEGKIIHWTKGFKYT